MMLASVTLVAGVGADIPGVATMRRFDLALSRCARTVETVIVANGAGSEAALALKRLAAAVPDLTVVFLAEPVHDDLARLVGIEHALGDHVLFADPLSDDPDDIPALLAPLDDGFDLVVADRRVPTPRRAIDRALMPVFAAAYRLSTGLSLDLRQTGLRVLSRAAALNVAGRPDAELRLRATAIGPGFPATSVRLPPPRPSPAARRRHHGLSGGLGLLLGASSLPLRTASYMAAAGGLSSALYGLYVLAVWLLKPDVAAGWTTLSLQVSGMMFVFSIVLLFLSEYVIQIHAAAPPRSRRHLVVRELRSPLSGRTGRLNIVDADGHFQLGKPAWFNEAV